MKRIFTAIDISDETRQKVSDYIETLKAEFPNARVGWDKPKKLHLTVKFLGDIDGNQLGNLTEAIRETAKQISNFKIRISKTGAFPTVKNARVLWLGVEDKKGSLKMLNEQLEIECERNGFARETRNFKAHLTIGRLREPNKSRELIERHLENEFESNEFSVNKISVYESRLKPTGSIYSIIGEKKFTNPSAFE